MVSVNRTLIAVIGPPGATYRRTLAWFSRLYTVWTGSGPLSGARLSASVKNTSLAIRCPWCPAGPGVR